MMSLQGMSRCLLVAVGIVIAAVVSFAVAIYSIVMFVKGVLLAAPVLLEIFAAINRRI